ncbi:MAG: hypothetical protein M3Z05_05975 [Gemmatimonadota bacterium]|nr:hypothetical protein [Gemmatimonadota bacterium]
MRRSLFVGVFPWLIAAPLVSPAAAQGLRTKIDQLFIFGSGGDPLFLAGSADPNNPASIRAHGAHFVPSAVSQNGSIIEFLITAIAGNVANAPIGSTSGGETFRFEAGVPVRTSISSGPIFGERAQTLGRGRASVGIGRTSSHFTSLRGVDLRSIDLYFTHQNVDFAGCDSTFGLACKQMGVPLLENDIMQFKLDMDINVEVNSIYATYGLFDNMDVGIVLPLVSTRLHGRSDAQIIPFGGPTAAHFFAGTPANPVLSASRDVDGSAFGLGDAAVRTKISVRQSERANLALLADARFATGDQEDLLGSGHFSARAIAILSARYGAFSPHGNVGYDFRAGGRQNDAVLGTVGFDDLMAERLTLAVDLVSELQVGRSTLMLPPPVNFDYPFRRTIAPTAIPDMADNIVNGSFGFKFAAPNGFTIITNALVPLNRGGLRPNVTYTTGLEFSF